MLLIALFAACGSSTDSDNRDGDPSLLFSNETSVPVYLTWQDGNEIFGKDTIPPHTSAQCSRFVAQPDSAQFQIISTENGAQSTYTAPFFNPADRPAWTVAVTPSGSGSPYILVTLVEIAC